MPSIESLVFPAALAGSASIGLAALLAGAPPIAAVVFVPLMIGAALLPVERGDLGAVETAMGLGRLLISAACFGTMFFVATTFSEWMASGLWPTALPLILQLVLALIIGDLGAYWFHRACHGTTLLHRLHELHHAAERNHPQSLTGNHVSNEICAYGSLVIPLILLGAGPPILALLAVFTAVHCFLRHADLDLDCGPAAHVFTTAGVHRRHHRVPFEQSTTNFGSSLVIWDHVFGTFLDVQDGRPTLSYDTENSSASWTCCTNRWRPRIPRWLGEEDGREVEG